MIDREPTPEESPSVEWHGILPTLASDIRRLRAPVRARRQRLEREARVSSNIEQIIELTHLEEITEGEIK